nr:hypothetical protein [Solanum melongena]WMB97054.1 hypothetical protein [Solanum aethiopicum]WMB97130.1 hypothetical protein [Solanum aethiopicum]
MYVGGFNFDLGLFFKACFITPTLPCLSGGLSFLLRKKRPPLSSAALAALFGLKFKGPNRFSFPAYSVPNFTAVFFAGSRVVGALNELLCSTNAISTTFSSFLISSRGTKAFSEDEAASVFDTFFACMDSFKLSMSC